MSLRHYISVTLALTLFTHCTPKGNSEMQNEALSIIVQQRDLFVGEWVNNKTMWYSAELTLQNNGTFKFHDQGCYGQDFSEGEWTYENGSVQLKSFDAFIQKEPERIKLPALSGSDDTVRIYLDKIQLQLKNDTLFSIDSEKLLKGATFYKAKAIIK